VGFNRSRVDIARSTATRRSSSHRNPRSVPATDESTIAFAAVNSLEHEVDAAALADDASADARQRETRAVAPGTRYDRGRGVCVDAKLAASAATAAGMLITRVRAAVCRWFLATAKQLFRWLVNAAQPRKPLNVSFRWMCRPLRTRSALLRSLEGADAREDRRSGFPGGAVGRDAAGTHVRPVRAEAEHRGGANIYGRNIRTTPGVSVTPGNGSNHPQAVVAVRRRARGDAPAPEFRARQRWGGRGNPATRVSRGAASDLWKIAGGHAFAKRGG
jgi:hypothetical protein